MDSASNFSQRLKELLFEHEVSPGQLAVNIGVSRSTAYRWTIVPLQITRKNLIAVADYFQCSIEFLIGRTDNDSKTAPSPCPPFGFQVRQVMKERNFTSYSLRKVSRFESIYFQKWDAGEEPSLPLLIELAGLFDCTIDYLVGRER